MSVRAVSRLEGRGRKDAGHQPTAEIQAAPEWVSVSIEIEVGLLLGLFARNQVRGLVTDISPERLARVPIGPFQGRDFGGELSFEIGLLAWTYMIAHADGDHTEFHSCRRLIVE